MFGSRESSLAGYREFATVSSDRCEPDSRRVVSLLSSLALPPLAKLTVVKVSPLNQDRQTIISATQEGRQCESKLGLIKLFLARSCCAFCCWLPRLLSPAGRNRRRSRRVPWAPAHNWGR